MFQLVKYISFSNCQLQGFWSRSFQKLQIVLVCLRNSDKYAIFAKPFARPLHIWWTMERVVRSAATDARLTCVRTCSSQRGVAASSAASAAASQRVRLCLHWCEHGLPKSCCSDHFALPALLPQCLHITSSIWTTPVRGWTATTSRSCRWEPTSSWPLLTIVK